MAETARREGYWVSVVGPLFALTIVDLPEVAEFSEVCGPHRSLSHLLQFCWAPQSRVLRNVRFRVIFLSHVVEFLEAAELPEAVSLVCGPLKSLSRASCWVFLNSFVFVSVAVGCYRSSSVFFCVSVLSLGSIWNFGGSGLKNAIFVFYILRLL